MDLITPTLQYGLAGIVIVAEALVIIRLYNDGRKLQDKFDAFKDATAANFKEFADRAITTMTNQVEVSKLISDKLSGGEK